jgi:DNA replication initiation complex subunit (GINS family)
MNQKDLLDALRNERRQPVDLNLGQVPVSPTIGRMGNYNVVVPGYSRRNAASELSTALSQLPQIAGQFRNIQEQAGVEEANSLTTEEVIKRVNAGDMEAKGFLAQFGKDKAFAEQLYQRTYESVIKPAFIKTAGEIDNLPAEEIAKIGNEEQFREYAKNKLVASISENNPDLLENIKSNPYQASMHNKAMDGAIPSFVEEANAKAVARKLKFTEEQSKQTLSNNLFSRADVTLPEYEWDDNKSFTQNTALGLQHGVNQRNALIDYYQDSINTLSAEASLDGVDDIAQEKIIQEFFRSKIDSLIRQEDTEQANALKAAIDGGDLTVNGRAFKHTKEGTDTLRIVDAAIEKYEDKLERENEKYDFDRSKIDEFYVTFIGNPLAQLTKGNPTPDEYETFIDDLIALDAGLYANQDLSFTEKRQLSSDIRAQISKIELRKENLSDSSEFYLNKPLVNDLATEFGLSTNNEIYYPTDSSKISNIRKRSESLGLESIFNRLAPTDRDFNGDPIIVPHQLLPSITDTTYIQALQKTLRPILAAYETEDGKQSLPLLDSKFESEAIESYSQTIRENFEKNYNEIFSRQLKNIATQAGFNIDEGSIDVVDDSIALQENLEGISDEEKRQRKLQRIKSGGFALDENGKIQFEGFSVPLLGQRKGATWREQGRAKVNPQRTIDTDAAFKTVTSKEALELFKQNDKIDRQKFVKAVEVSKFGYGKGSKARISRHRAISRKADKISAKSWEISQSEIFGLPMDILRNQGLDEYSETLKANVFAESKRYDYSINYDMGKSLSGADAPKERLFNFEAVQKAITNDDYSDLIEIASIFGHVPKNATKKNPKVKSFLEGQLGVINKYGFGDIPKLDETNDK